METLNVSLYISELLFRHDCVVIPGFGAFVCTYAPAKIHPARHTFAPPGKQIVFNKFLQQNDGLLAQAIASEMQCTFDEAMTGINEFASGVQSQLKAGKKAELHNIGTFSLDPENIISFEAFPEVNYLVDSFGLSSFQSMPVMREQAGEKRKPVQRVDRVVPEANERKAGDRRKTRRMLAAAAILLPFLIIATIWITTKNGDGVAGLGFLEKKKAPEYKTIQWYKDTVVENPVEQLQADTNGIARITLDDQASPVIVNIFKVPPDTTQVMQKQGKQAFTPKGVKGSRYYVVGGCFGIPKNVEKFMNDMQAKGYKPVIIDQSRSKLTHVGVASFSTKDEAKEFVRLVRAEIPEAWIMKEQ
ncbi:MAG TPA: hypothetical protein VI731_07380 [Bacteroidia bacterium]|nr:hypothetical protein [Bacteroidia bacterium]